MTGTNLSFYTTVSNHGFRVEKLYGESNRTLQAVGGVHWKVSSVLAKATCAFVVCAVDQRQGSLVDMKNLTNIGTGEGKNEFSGYRNMRKKCP